MKVENSSTTFFGKVLGLGIGFFKQKARAVASATAITEEPWVC